LVGLALGVFLFYRVFLREISRDRHENLKELFINLGYHFLFGSVVWFAFLSLQWFSETPELLGRTVPYLGLIALVSWCIILVKIARIFIFEYLFVGHMTEGVPLLLVNIFTLLLSLSLAAWLASDIFGVRLTPVLATSAIFSIVLGLALQDTLGNLFAGVALQLDKPYEIGDWIEVSGGDKKWTGQVLEISWRSTVLLAFTDETITIPNRVMSQAQVANFSPQDRPIVRSLMFRIPYGFDLERAKALVLKSAEGIPQILTLPEPAVLVNETGESWIGLKLLYYMHNYGSQYTVADLIYTRALKLFEENGLPFAGPRLTVITEDRGSA
jgi:small-conductance mechanosensitive channel